MEILPGTTIFSISAPSEAAADQLLDRGPWSILGYSFSMHHWPASCRLDDIPLHLISFWIQVLGLKQGQMTYSNARMIGTQIGEFFVLMIQTRMMAVVFLLFVFVWILVLLSPQVSGSLTLLLNPPRLKFNMKDSNFCIYCGRFGHIINTCTFPRHPSSERIGPWMAIPTLCRLPLDTHHNWDRFQHQSYVSRHSCPVYLHQSYATRPWTSLPVTGALVLAQPQQGHWQSTPIILPITSFPDVMSDEAGPSNPLPADKGKAIMDDWDDSSTSISPPPPIIPDVEDMQLAISLSLAELGVPPSQLALAHQEVLLESTLNAPIFSFQPAQQQLPPHDYSSVFAPTPHIYPYIPPFSSPDPRLPIVGPPLNHFPEIALPSVNPASSEPIFSQPIPPLDSLATLTHQFQQLRVRKCIRKALAETDHQLKKYKSLALVSPNPSLPSPPPSTITKPRCGHPPFASSAGRGGQGSYGCPLYGSSPKPSSTIPTLETVGVSSSSDTSVLQASEPLVSTSTMTDFGISS
ncbi:hypothetical protein M0R45_000409 [Rubus argutus]|uniref:CCHC-type domain-containing protein n=1 Tax=Rubus argutus TaxID=59490 RepID=A0AAW1VKV6_RUBAR